MWWCYCRFQVVPKSGMCNRNTVRLVRVGDSHGLIRSNNDGTISISGKCIPGIYRCIHTCIYATAFISIHGPTDVNCK